MSFSLWVYPGVSEVEGCAQGSVEPGGVYAGVSGVGGVRPRLSEATHMSSTGVAAKVAKTIVGAWHTDRSSRDTSMHSAEVVPGKQQTVQTRFFGTVCMAPGKRQTVLCGHAFSALGTVL